MSVREVYVPVVLIGFALSIMLYAPVVRADATVEFVCSTTSQNLDISVDDQEKVMWKENSTPAIEFRIEFDKDSNVEGRKSPFKSCFLFFCKQKKKLGHDDAKNGEKINVKPEHHGKYNYTIHCANDVNIDPMIQVPRQVPPAPSSKP